MHSRVKAIVSSILAWSLPYWCLATISLLMFRTDPER